MAKVLSWGSLAGMLVCLIVMICVALLQYDYEIRSFNTIDRSVLRRVRNDADVMDSSVAWDCDRPWPRHAIFLTLYVPPRGTNGTATHHSWNPADLPEWYDIFLRGKCAVLLSCVLLLNYESNTILLLPTVALQVCFSFGLGSEPKPR